MAESQAVLEIFNLALIRIGNPPVTQASQSPDCQAVYPEVRDYMLSLYPWPFAVVRQELVQLTDVPPIGVGRNADSFSYQYRMPTLPFPLRILDIDSSRLRYRVEIYVPVNTPETQIPVILTDMPGVIVRYIGRVSEGQWSPVFTSVVALRLATTIANRAGGKRSLFAEIKTDYLEALAAAKDTLGHQDSPNVAKFNNTYIDVRGSGHSQSLYPFLQDFEEAL